MKTRVKICQQGPWSVRKEKLIWCFIMSSGWSIQVTKEKLGKKILSLWA